MKERERRTVAWLLGVQRELPELLRAARETRKRWRKDSWPPGDGEMFGLGSDRLRVQHGAYIV